MKNIWKFFILLVIFVSCISVTYASDNSTVVCDVENIDESGYFIPEDIDTSEKFVKLIDDDSIYAVNKTFSDSQRFETFSNYSRSSICPTLYIQTSTIYQGNKLNFYMVDGNNDTINLQGESIVIEVNGVNYTRFFDEYGIASLNINLGPNNYIVNYWYNGDNNYLPSSGTKTINVLQKNTIVVPFSVYVHRGNSGYGFKAKLLDQYGIPISNRTVHILVNTVEYTRTTNDNGVVNLNINLAGYYYPVSVWYDNENRGYSSSSTVSWSLYVLDSNNLNQPTMSSTTSVVSKGSQFQVKMTDSNGNPLSGKSITLYIGSYSTTVVTNSYGIASCTIPNTLANGYYAVIMYFTGDSYYKSASAYKLLLIPNATYSNDYSYSDPNGGIGYALDYYKTSYDMYCDYSSGYVSSLRNILISSCTDDLEKAVAIQFYCFGINYQNYSNHVYGGLESLLRCAGNCMDTTAALVTLCKSSGLAVRYVIGTGNGFNNEGHAWAQICINNKWVVSEPTNTIQFGMWNHGYSYTSKFYCPLSSDYFN